MTKKIVLGVLCILMLIFIFGNSILPPDLSGKISSAVGEILASFLGTGNATQTVGGMSVRKVGHLVEFSALGVAVSLLLYEMVKGAYIRCSTVTLAGLLVPVVDETLQLFSGRGSALTDVWIDVCGYAFGVGVACIALFFAKQLKRRVKNNNKKR